MSIISVGGLYRYPLKSGAPEALLELRFDRDGPEGDRIWMVVDDKGDQITARETPRLLSIKASQLPDGRLRLAAPMQADLETRIGGDTRDAALFSNPLKVVDAGDQVADWLGLWLGRPARMVQRTVATQRGYANQIYSGFGDLAPVLIVNQNTLRELNTRLPHPVGIDRFRANIVLENAPAHDEDGWQEITIGDTVLKVIEPCVRCVLTTIDPISGRRDLGLEPLRSLSGYRAGEVGDIHFGVYAQVVRGGIIGAGDRAEMQRHAAPRQYEVRTPIEIPPTDHRILRLETTEPAAASARHLWWRYDDGQPTDIEPGQFISLRVPQADGTQPARSFTISDQRDTGQSIRLSVRQQGDGGVSDYLVNTAMPGDTIWATGVHGDFTMTQTQEPALFLSAGSGVTPFLAFIKGLDACSDVCHFHVDRSPERAIGFDVLDAAQAAIPGYQLHSQWTGTQGRLQANQLANIPGLEARHVWICGPDAFVDDMRAMLDTLKVPVDQIQFETFAAPDEGQATNTFHTVTLDDETPVQIDAGLSLLGAMRAAGLSLASSCEMGTCKTCQLRLLDGQCHEMVPSDQPGYVLPCTSFARSDLRLARPASADNN